MVQAKTSLFETDLSRKALIFKALAHPARLNILQFLAQTQTCITGDISEELPLGRTTVNQHIKELKTAGLITGHKEGTTTKYCLNSEKIEEISIMLGSFLGQLNIKDYKCE
ncbi:MAG: helix-turn-helix transcriptional regulator [Bacteroidales bacterium]|nr:helix-turn-helix transcriptional regulator [Bacteroidales bacterium]